MINNSYLLGLYGVSTTTTSGLGSTTASATKRTQPTAPWSSTSTASLPTASESVRSALAGRRMINEGAVELDLSGASADYRKMFALYQGLNTLSALADRAGTKGLTAIEQAQLSKRFAAGIEEIGAYLNSAQMEGVRLVQGVSQTTAKSTVAIDKASNSFVTAPIHDGALSSPVAAFEGEVKFSITTKGLRTTTTVDIDLADMGSTPRTIDNVISHINGKLEAAGVETRMSRQMIAAEPKTVQAGGKTITLPAGPDQWALKIKNGAGESVSFGAPDVSDAVYVTQGVGNGSTQLLKFQADGGAAPDAQQGVGDTFWTAGRTGQTTLPKGVEAVRATAVGPDGSVWMVADLSAGDDTQPIKGQSDVALMRYDSAGNLMQTTLLGAASAASGFAIAVGEDGRVAVAGSVTGALEPGVSGADATKADSFVTVFDANGHEQWTQRRGAKAADEATQVGFGADGTVYVAGRSQSAMPGATQIGGWDGYLQTFKETSSVKDGMSAVAVSTKQFGSAGDDSVQAMTRSGSDLYTAGVENGRAIVRRFTLDADGVPTLAATRDLGYARGEIAGISVEGGKIVLAGQTTNGALDIATVTNPHAGGTDVFVATMSMDLQASADDRLTYFGGAGNDTAADVVVKDGKVWITGVADRAADAKAEDPTKAYLARLDIQTGAVEMNQTWRAEGDQAKTGTIAFASGGGSVLDRLGLPQGELGGADSQLLTQSTALRAGDQFKVTPANGSRSVTITIAADETLDSLAKKIVTASGRQLEAKVVTDTKVTPPEQRLSITTAVNRQGATLSAGAVGKDALAGLGLSPGFIGRTVEGETAKTFGLNLSNKLNLSDAASIKAAVDALAISMTAVRSAYRSLAPATTVTNSYTGKGSSTVYQQTQLANFQAALSRLTATTA